MDELESARGLSMKRGRTQQDVAEARQPAVLEQRLDKRRRRADAHLNFVMDKEFSKHHAQWWGEGMQLFRDTPSNLGDGAIDVLSSAMAADERNRILGQELPPERRKWI